MTQNGNLLRIQKYNDQIYQLISSGLQSLLLAKTLSTKNEKDYDLTINFFLFHENLYIKNSIIELHKLFSDSSNEKYNIFKYLRLIENNKRHFNNLTSAKIVEWRDMLLKHAETIGIVTNVRSKYYAHRDNDYQEYLDKAKIELDFPQFDALFADLEYFYIDSNRLLFGNIVFFNLAITVDYFEEVLYKHLKK